MAEASGGYGSCTSIGASPTQREGRDRSATPFDNGALYCKATVLGLCETKLLPERGTTMRMPRFRVRTLMVAVGVVALVIWGRDLTTITGAGGSTTRMRANGGKSPTGIAEILRVRGA
jgi:hypothetical protein